MWKYESYVLAVSIATAIYNTFEFDSFVYE